MRDKGHRAYAARLAELAEDQHPKVKKLALRMLAKNTAGGGALQPAVHAAIDPFFAAMYINTIALNSSFRCVHRNRKQSAGPALR